MPTTIMYSPAPLDTGQADLIVSGDPHLHGLGGHYQSIPIVTPAQAVRQIWT